MVASIVFSTHKSSKTLTFRWSSVLQKATMVYRSGGGLQRDIDQNLSKETKRKRKRNLGCHSNCQAATTISSKNSNNNPLTLLRTIIMIITMWYHSFSSTRGKSAPIMVANAWTISAFRTSSQRTRGCHLYSRQKAIPSSIYPNVRTTYLLTQTRSSTRSSHRLFSSATIVGEGSESTSNTDTETETPQYSTNSQDDWKESPLVNPTITFETLLVPNSQLTKWITHPDIQHRLAKPDNWEFLKHVHPRIKLVQDYNDDKKYKQLLLLPSSLSQENASNHTATGFLSSEGLGVENKEDSDAWLSELLLEESNENGKASIQPGPSRPMSISPNQLSFQYILKRLLPESALPPPSAYEQIGHVAHFNLKEIHLPFKDLIGSALLESNSGDSIQTVVNKVGKVDGKFRTYECEIIANTYQISKNDSSDMRPDDKETSSSSLLETTVVEDGISIELNVAECYWCTRLSGERKELIKDIMKGRTKAKPNEVAPPLVVADVFCGAGAVCMLLAKKIKDQDKSWQPDPQSKQQQQPTEAKQQQQQDHPSLTILANDWNPKAIEYMNRSIVTNGMDKEQDESLYHKFKLSCRDSYDFLSELGGEKQTTKANPYIKKKLRSKNQTKPIRQKEQPPLMPDHVLMNFPLEAPQFLGAIRWWSWKRLRDEGIRRTPERSQTKSTWCPRFHIYTFARASSPRANDEEEMAVNLVANELLPQQYFDSSEETDATNSTEESCSTPPYRRNELDSEFGSSFSTRLVRDVAPGKVVVCVSFSVTPKLIRYMQGDYS